MRCDFCSCVPVSVTFPCQDFEMVEGQLKSINAWAACDGCRAFINRNDLDGLLKRIRQTSAKEQTLREWDYNRTKLKPVLLAFLFARESEQPAQV